MYYLYFVNNKVVCSTTSKGVSVPDSIKIESEEYDLNYSYSLVDGKAVKGDLIQIDTEEEERLIQEVQSTEYQRQREFEYPPIGDQLDALFHAGVFPEEMASKIQLIKNKYPKT
jgi:hypothetical protein